MKIPLELYVALRNLSARRFAFLPSVITLIVTGGIAVGVMALILAIGIMSGMQRAVRDSILGTNPHIMVMTYGEGLRLDNWQAVAATAREHPDVTLAEPFVYTEALIFQDADYQQGFVLRGITEPSVERLRQQLTAGSWDFDSTVSGLPGIVLGFRMANRLLVHPGDTISIVSGEGSELTPAGFIPKFKKLEVVGLFRSGMFEYDNQFAYISLSDAQRLVGLDSAVTALALQVEEPWDADKVADSLEARLGFPYTLRDWKTMNEGLFNALKLEKRLTALGFSLIILVAAFNIVATLIMIVTDKTREIGILRSMGMTSRRILKVFVLQGVFMGCVGTALGVAGGLWGGWVLEFLGFTTLPGDVYIVTEVPIRIGPLDLLLIVAGSILLSFLATIYPSLRASWLTPVEAIRHE